MTQKSSTTWKPGQSGNPLGKRKGTVHKATQLVVGMLNGEAEQIVRKVIDGALAGDAVCLRLCMERLAPPTKERPLSLILPDTDSAAGISAAQQVVVQAVSAGEILPGEASTLAGILETRRKALETEELEARVTVLEELRK